MSRPTSKKWGHSRLRPERFRLSPSGKPIGAPPQTLYMPTNAVLPNRHGERKGIVRRCGGNVAKAFIKFIEQLIMSNVMTSYIIACFEI